MKAADHMALAIWSPQACTKLLDGRTVSLDNCLPAITFINP